MNGDEKRAHWNHKYERGLPRLTKPDPFFLSAYERFVDQLFPNGGTALDLAAGLGRHALWLAHRMWKVTAVDISEVAIGRLAHTADQQSLALSVFAMDAAEYTLAPSRFDLVVLFYHWDRSLLPKIVLTLNPGGLLISKLHVRWETEMAVAMSAATPLNKNELPRLLPHLQVVHHRERLVGDRGIVEFAERKPELDNKTQ